MSWFVRRWREGSSRRASWLAGAAALLVLLGACSSAALAAPGRHRKRDRPSARQVEPVTGSPPADTLPPDSAGPPAAASQPEPADTPPLPAAPVATSGPAPVEPAPPVAAGPAPPPAQREANDVALAMGRREASRVAAGRIEVAVMSSLDVGRRDFTYSDPVGDLPQPYR